MSESKINPTSNTPNATRANPVSQAQHRREVFWQITFPLIAVGVLLLAGAVFLVLAPAPSASLGADISLIYILLLNGICLFPVLLLIGGLAFGVWKANQVLPNYTYLAQGFFLLMRDKVRAGMDKLVEPLLAAEAKTAALKTVLPAARRKRF